MSDHLRQVHHLYGDERKKWLGRARFSLSHKHCHGSLPARPTHTVKEIRCVRKKTYSVLKPTKAARKVTASMLTKPIRISTSAINSHFWLWVLHKVGKRILSNKFWKTIVSCTKSKKVFAFFGTIINGKNVTKS